MIDVEYLKADWPADKVKVYGSDFASIDSLILALRASLEAVIARMEQGEVQEGNKLVLKLLPDDHLKLLFNSLGSKFVIEVEELPRELLDLAQSQHSLGLTRCSEPSPLFGDFGPTVKVENISDRFGNACGNEGDQEEA